MWLKNRNRTKQYLGQVRGRLLIKQYRFEKESGPPLKDWEQNFLDEASRWLNEFYPLAKDFNVRFALQRANHIAWLFLPIEGVDNPAMPDCDEDTRWAMLNLVTDIINEQLGGKNEWET